MGNDLKELKKSLYKIFQKDFVDNYLMKIDLSGIDQEK